MQTRRLMLTILSVFIAVAFLTGCASTPPKQAQQKYEPPQPTAQNFIQPKVTLDYVEVAHYWGWWYYSKKIKPTMGKEGDYGAPLDLAFVFNIENPNDYPISLQNCKFTVAFEEFDLNTVSSTDVQWIPAKKTNQVRIHAMFDGRQSLLSLLVTGGFKLKEKGAKPGAAGALGQLAKWWEGIPEFAFPIFVKEGSAVFEAGDLTEVVSFSAKYPEK